MKRIFVTGGCGFIGANLAPRLFDLNFEVTIYDNFSRGDLALLEDAANYNVIEGDVLDYQKLKTSVAGHDAVIHLAALGSVVESVTEPAENFKSNAEGTFNVLNAAREACIPKLVFASTGGALMGNTPPPVNEKSVPKPISPYGASKLAGEGYCSAFANVYDMSVTALRFANVVGPISAHKRGAVTKFIEAIESGGEIEIFGDGQAVRDFLYVGDLCQGIIKALKHYHEGFEVFHLASGAGVTIKELADLMCEVAGKSDYPLVFEEKRIGEVERNFASYDKAKAVLGFHLS